MSVRRLYHITTAVEAEAGRAKGEYAPRAYQDEGFVHCSYRHQVLAVANRIYVGQDDLVLIEIDPDKVDAPIVEENLEGGVELFPHIYARLRLTAIRRVLPFPCDSAGRFVLPERI